MMLVRAAHLAAACLLFGASFYPLYAPTGRFLDRPLRTVVRMSAIVALVSGIVWMASLSAAALEKGGATPLSWTNAATFFLGTRLGTLCLVRLTLLLFVCFVCLGLRRNSWTVRTQAPVLAAVAGVVLASAALDQRPTTTGESVHSAALLLQALHLVAAGAWLGGTVPLFVVVTAEARRRNQGLVRRALHCFLSMGMVAAALVLVSGTFDAARRIGGFGELGATGYGRTVLVKAALFLVLIGLTATNRLVLLPRIAGSPPRTSLVRTAICLQWIAALAVIGAAATLSQAAPPR